MSLAQLLNVTHAVMIENLDEEGEARLDALMRGEAPKPETQAEAFLRARGQRPVRGAPPEVMRRADGPPPMPKGIPLAPVGVQIREPEPTRGLEVLQAAFGQAPRPSKARPAVPRG